MQNAVTDAKRGGRVPVMGAHPLRLRWRETVAPLPGFAGAGPEKSMCRNSLYALHRTASAVAAEVWLAGLRQVAERRGHGRFLGRSMRPETGSGAARARSVPASIGRFASRSFQNYSQPCDATLPCIVIPPEFP